MARVNRILVAFASGPILYSGLASAIGLGEITLHSALNQPLEAEIGLLDVGDLTDSDIKVSLASAEVFERSGVDRVLFLNDLRFSPMIRGSSGRIRVVSNKPVREPYLNFIVEVARPNGRLLREYTLLLDPPEFSAYNPVAAPLRAAAGQRDGSRGDAPGATRQPASAAAPPATQGKRYTVVKGDSLWAIAQRQSAGSGMSTAQMMNGIHALNPGAFANGDPSRLSVGQSLLLPDAAMLSASTSTAPAAAPGSDAQATSGSAPGPLSAPASPGQPAPLPQQIAEVQRRVDTELLNSENERLQLRQDIADLQLKLENLQRQMEQKDAQLARLQGALDTRGAEGAVEGANVPPAGAAVAPDANVADRQAQEPADSQPGTTPSEAPAPAASDTSAPAPAPAPAADAAQSPAASPDAEPQVVVEAPAGPDAWSRGLLLIGGVLLLAVLALVLLRRRQGSRPEEAGPEREPEPRVRPAVVAVTAERPRIGAVPQPRVEPVVATAAAAAAAPAPAPVPRPQPQPVAPRVSSDSLDGANIYIAYGRFNDAESALRAAIVQEPKRTDLRFRLLEVLGELRDPSGFAAEERSLLEMGVGPARIEQIKARYPGIDQHPSAEPMLADPEFVLADEAADQPPATLVVHRDDELTDEFQLNLDDLPLDADWDSLSPFKTEAPKAKATSKPEPVQHHVDPAFRSNLQDMPEVFELDDLEQADRLELPDLPQAEELGELTFDFEDPLEADDDLDHLAARQENLMKLNLALAYIDQGDVESACSILNEVIDGGDEEQKQEARQLLAKIA